MALIAGGRGPILAGSDWIESRYFARICAPVGHLAAELAKLHERTACRRKSGVTLLAVGGGKAGLVRLRPINRSREARAVSMPGKSSAKLPISSNAPSSIGALRKRSPSLFSCLQQGY